MTEPEEQVEQWWIIEDTTLIEVLTKASEGTDVFELYTDMVLLSEEKRMGEIG